jgi:hypothetical protein
MADPAAPTPAATCPPPDGHEQRIARRHRCSLAALTRLYEPATGKHYFAWVHDISARGVAFDLRALLEPGQEVRCLLTGSRPEQRYEVLAEVVHAGLIDGLHRVGCRFRAPLPQDQLDAVLCKLRGG